MPTAEQMLGVRAEDLHGQGLFDRVHVTDRPGYLKALADAATGVYFVGRLATYKYYNMDQVTAQALTVFKQIMAKEMNVGRIKIFFMLRETEPW